MILMLILTKNIDGLSGMHCEGYTRELSQTVLPQSKKMMLLCFT